MTRALLPLVLALPLSALAGDTPEDPLVWLEDVTSEQSMDWVKAQNAASTEALSAEPGFAALKDRLRAIYDSTDRIPYVGKRGDWFYNFWRDADHPKGVWRRTTLESYRTDSPEWDVVLDLDALAEKEGESWVYKGVSCLKPDYDRCLLRLSRGGADATVTREFDVASRTFVEGGFFLPEAKGSLDWIDIDTVFVSTDFGEGSLTESGYPRQIKRWTRGTDLAEATLEFEGTVEDVRVGAWRDTTEGYEGNYIWRATTFFTNEAYVEQKGEWVKIDKPDHTSAAAWRGWLLFELRKDWEIEGTTYKAGSLLAANQKKWMKGKRSVQVLFEPTERTSLSGFSDTRNHLILNVLDNVKNSLSVLTPGKKAWTSAPLQGVPEYGRVSASAVDPDENDAFFLTVSDYVTPSTLAYGEIGGSAPETLKSLPAMFDATGLKVTQHMATSKDGTKIPYFQIAARGPPARRISSQDHPVWLRRLRGLDCFRATAPAQRHRVAGGWRRLRRGQHPRRRRVRSATGTSAAQKENKQQVLRGLRSPSPSTSSSARSPARPTWASTGASNGGAADGQHATPCRPELFGAIVSRRAAARHEALPHCCSRGPRGWANTATPTMPEEWAWHQAPSRRTTT